MPRGWSTSAVFAVLAMAVSVSACSDGALTPTEPFTQPAGVAATGHGPGSASDDDGSSFEVIGAEMEPQTVVGTFGRRGGSLEVAGQQIVVRANTVPEPTEFTMTVRGGDPMVIELSAIGVRSGTDYGARGLDQPVMLKLTVPPGSDVDSSADLLVVRITDDGYERVQRSVSTGGDQAIAWIDRFSAFCMAMN